MNKLIAKVQAYLSNEDGLVTIEWVGIAAVVVVAGIVITGMIMTSANDLGITIDTQLGTVEAGVQTATVPTFGAGGTP